MAAFSVCPPVRFESPPLNLVCAWSKGHECQCDTNVNGCCAVESHEEMARSSKGGSLPSGTLAGRWVVDGSSCPADGFAGKLEKRTALYRAAVQPTMGKSVASLSDVELRSRSKFLRTGLSIRARKNGSRASACNATGALEDVVTRTLAAASIELVTECSCGDVPRGSRSAKTGCRGKAKAKGEKATRKSRSTKIQHTTGCLRLVCPAPPTARVRPCAC